MSKDSDKTMKYKTEPESFWSGEGGYIYHDRCSLTEKHYASRLSLYSSVLSKTCNINSILEIGAGTGQSLITLKTLLPEASLNAIEINEKTAEILKKNLPECEIVVDSIMETDIAKKYDLIFTFGLLMTITEEYLPDIYEKMYTSCNRYIAFIEYYNPTPAVINYRDGSHLFKRDYAGELMDKYSDLKLVDYGFIYHRDNCFPMGDFTWFLLEKR